FFRVDLRDQQSAVVVIEPPVLGADTAGESLADVGQMIGRVIFVARDGAVRLRDLVEAAETNIDLGGGRKRFAHSCGRHLGDAGDLPRASITQVDVVRSPV